MYKRILTIQDISCVGQCSITVALPILSACGVETSILPTAVLSTHTGGFKNFTFRDLCEDIPGIIKHWKSENIMFDAIYTGYLGNCDDVNYVKEIAENLLAEDSKLIVDPAMGDNGKLYYGFDEKYVEAMRTLCEKADLILPNITEACFLLGISYPENVTVEIVDAIMCDLHKKFGVDVVLTGVGFATGETGVSVLCGGNKYHYNHKRIGQSFHGTGDIYASAFVGALMKNKSILASAQIAADYVVECIENTLDDKSHWYGVKFETALSSLIEAINS